MKKLVQVKLDSELVKEVDILAVKEETRRGEVMEGLIRKGLEMTHGSGHSAGTARFD